MNPISFLTDVSWFRRKAEPKTRRPSTRRLRIESLENRRNLSGGMLDVTFDGDGVANTLVGSGNRATAVVAAPDGKVISAGYAYTKSGASNFALTRYNENGSLDASFGSGGSVSNVAGRASSVALQSDGKVLVAGRSGDDFAVARYTAAGALDKSFGRNGVATIDIGAKTVDDGRAMVIQSDGKIVVAGTTRLASQTTASLALIRLTASGALDSAFGASGKVVRTPAAGSLPQLTPDDRGLGMALDPGTNKLVVSGALDYNAQATAVFRFNANGTLDSSFSGDGEVTLLSLRDTSAVSVQSDHRVVVAGTHYDGSGSSAGFDFALVRLSADGSTDNTFGTSGLVVTPEPYGNSVQDVEIQSDGQIVLFGYHDNAELMMTRYRSSDGSLDPTFGANGFVIGANLGPMYCMDMALAPNGKIVAAGSHSGGSAYSIVARFLATGPTIGSFAASSSVVTAGSAVTLTAGSVAAQNAGSTVTQVAIYGDSNGDGKLDASDLLLGYATQTTAGTWTLNRSTVGWAAGSYKLFARARDSLGAQSDALSLDLTVV